MYDKFAIVAVYSTQHWGCEGQPIVTIMDRKFEKKSCNETMKFCSNLFSIFLLFLYDTLL